jgi:hypothetical protein
VERCGLLWGRRITGRVPEEIFAEVGGCCCDCSIILDTVVESRAVAIDFGFGSAKSFEGISMTDPR